MQERQRRTNHSESFPLWGATFLHNPWHRGLEARWMPYAPLRRRRRPLREYSFPPILHKSPRFPCRRRRYRHIYMMAPKAPYLASAAILYTSRGRSPQPVREASAGPGQNPGSPGPKGPAAGSTLTPVRACQPSGILGSTAPIPMPTPTALTSSLLIYLYIIHFFHAKH